LGELIVSILREFMLKTLLWLPASFALWFYFSDVLVWPVAHLVRSMLLSVWPLLFAEVAQQGHLLEVDTHVLISQVNATAQSGVGALVLTVNPLVYGFGLPLFIGLAMATPLSGVRRLWQLTLVLIVISFVQTAGVAAECLKQLAFSAGPAGATAVAAQGLSENGLALAYQFGFLILPAVTPIVLWVGFNQRFIEKLVRPVNGTYSRDMGS